MHWSNHFAHTTYPICLHFPAFNLANDLYNNNRCPLCHSGFWVPKVGTGNGTCQKPNPEPTTVPLGLIFAGKYFSEDVFLGTIKLLFSWHSHLKIPPILMVFTRKPSGENPGRNLFQVHAFVEAFSRPGFQLFWGMVFVAPDFWLENTYGPMEITTKTSDLSLN